MGRYVTFDLDGTLVDSIDGVADCINYVLERYGYGRLGREELKKAIGVKSLDEVFSNVKERDEMIGLYRSEYGRRFYKRVREFPGVREALSYLKDKGYGVAVVTLKPQELALKVLDYVGIRGLVDWVLGWGVIKAKEAGEVLRKLRELDPDAEVVAYVGDKWKDMEVGRRLGARTIGVLYGLGSAEELEGYADHLIESPYELMSIL